LVTQEVQELQEQMVLREILVHQVLDYLEIKVSLEVLDLMDKKEVRETLDHQVNKIISPIQMLVAYFFTVYSL